MYIMWVSKFTLMTKVVCILCTLHDNFTLTQSRILTGPSPCPFLSSAECVGIIMNATINTTIHRRSGVYTYLSTSTFNISHNGPVNASRTKILLKPAQSKHTQTQTGTIFTIYIQLTPRHTAGFLYYILELLEGRFLLHWNLRKRAPLYKGHLVLIHTSTYLWIKDTSE